MKDERIYVRSTTLPRVIALQQCPLSSLKEKLSLKQCLPWYSYLKNKENGIMYPSVELMFLCGIPKLRIIGLRQVLYQSSACLHVSVARCIFVPSSALLRTQQAFGTKLRILTMRKLDATRVRSSVIGFVHPVHKLKGHVHALVRISQKHLIRTMSLVVLVIIVFEPSTCTTPLEISRIERYRLPVAL